MTDNQMLAAFIVTILLVTIWVTVTNRKRNRAELAARKLRVDAMAHLNLSRRTHSMEFMHKLHSLFFLTCLIPIFL